jgi:carbonic anhydrase
MQKLIQGIHQFQENVFRSQRLFFERLADGQRPLALFVTCSDSRVNPNLITQTDPGELFILRNAGNIVPPHSANPGGEEATVEFAISELQIRDIIICGHTGCGAMGSLLAPGRLAEMPAVAHWLSHAEATRRIIREKYGHLSEQTRLTAAVQENVLVQLENLRTHPSVAAGLAQGAVKLHGWVYKIETGEVFAFDPHGGQFLPIQDTGIKPLATQWLTAPGI